MTKNKTFVSIDSDGNEIVNEIIFTFDSKKTNKNYIIYSDNSKNEFGKLNLYASCYNTNIENIELKPVETEEEWQIIQTIIDTLNEDLK